MFEWREDQPRIGIVTRSGVATRNVKENWKKEVEPIVPISHRQSLAAKTTPINQLNQPLG